jgi:hypothetical protein
MTEWPWSMERGEGRHTPNQSDGSDQSDSRASGVARQAYLL